MRVVRQLWFLKRSPLQPLQGLVPALAGSLVLGASFLPWLRDPWGALYSAWQLPLDPGWQFHYSWLNYGWLCLACAIYALLVAVANWYQAPGAEYLLHRHRTAGLLCFLPAGLFCFQFLFCDTVELHQLAQHQAQVLLIQQHFGYSVDGLQLRLEPLTIDSQLPGPRLALFVGLLLPGALLPLVSGCFLLYCRRFFTTPPGSDEAGKLAYRFWLPALLSLAILCGRAPLALGCEYQAHRLLAMGEYTAALKWLNLTAMLNPDLTRTVFYHRERGKALYFLNPLQSTSDSDLYLVEVYRSLGAYVDAYQELQALYAIDAHSQTEPWLQDEASLVLSDLTESEHPLQGTPVIRITHDAKAMVWLHLLLMTDSGNLYAHYLAGRIAYEQQNYGVGQSQLLAVLRLSSDNDIQSSAYTYLALGEASQGAYEDSRRLLFQAVALDYHYRNNTAREALSGLH